MCLPKAVEKIPHEDICGHLYLGVYIPNEGKWVDVDGTWDRKLTKVFEISAWDGKNNTPIAVKPLRASKEENISVSDDDISFREDRKINGEFYRAFNEWLEKTRAKCK